MSRNEIIIRQSRARRTVYVSINGGRSWIVIRPDGSTSEQWRHPVGAPRYFTEVCCEHDCDLIHDEY